MKKKPLSISSLAGGNLEDLENYLLVLRTFLEQLIEQAVVKALKGEAPDLLRQVTTKPYLTKKELMELTGWSSRQVEYAKSKRRIPYVRRGRLVLFPTDEVFAFLEEGRVPAKEKGNGGAR